MDKIKVIIADDKAGYRNLIAAMLNADKITVIAEAADGKQLLNLLHRIQPDVVLLDLEMPVMDGNKAFELMQKSYPELKVIIISFYFEPVLVEHYLKRGAKGYIPKDTLEPGLLMEVLQEIQNGGSYMPAKPAENKMYSERQIEIMPLIFDGLTNKEIAGEVYITERAVEKQRQKIYERSGANKPMDFYKYAFTRGFQFLSRSRATKKMG